MTPKTKLLLLAAGAGVGLYLYSTRCDQREIDAVARPAAEGTRGMSATAAAQTLFEALPRQVPRMWSSCRPALLKALDAAGVAPGVTLALTLWTQPGLAPATVRA